MLLSIVVGILVLILLKVANEGSLIKKFKN